MQPSNVEMIRHNNTTLQNTKRQNYITLIVTQ